MLATTSGNEVWQRRLATKSGNDFGPCHSERLISLFRNNSLLWI
jgi:hypothetical protein